MARKLVLFLLLAAVWAALYLLLSGQGATGPGAFFFSPARASQEPLPRPWAGRQVTVRMLPVAVAPAAEAQEGCTGAYRVQKGDTLGRIASRCGLGIADIQALNPTLSNPNRIYAGQEILLSSKGARAGMALSSRAVRSAAAGSRLQLEARGLPPGADARVGVGLSALGYRVIAQAPVDADGVLRVEVTVPVEAGGGEEGFWMVLAGSNPVVQGVSETFVVTP